MLTKRHWPFSFCKVPDMLKARSRVSWSMGAFIVVVIANQAMLPLAPVEIHWLLKLMLFGLNLVKN